MALRVVAEFAREFYSLPKTMRGWKLIWIILLCLASMLVFQCLRNRSSTTRVMNKSTSELHGLELSIKEIQRKDDAATVTLTFYFLKREQWGLDPFGAVHCIFLGSDQREIKTRTNRVVFDEDFLCGKRDYFQMPLVVTIPEGGEYLAVAFA